MATLDLSMFQDAAQYLRMSQQEMLELQTQKPDGKKYAWVPDKQHAYLQGEVISSEGGKAKLKTLEEGKEVTLKEDDVQLMNPPRYNKCEDMVNMTHLNEASVLKNLNDRYKAFMIYVSGEEQLLIHGSIYFRLIYRIVGFLDVLRSFLCHCKPVQNVTRLRSIRYPGIQGKKKN